MNITAMIVFFKEHIILSITWIVLLIIVNYTTISYWLLKPSILSHDSVIFLINKKNAIVVDLRNNNEYYSGHIINSINIPIQSIQNSDINKLNKFKNKLLILVNNDTVSYFMIRHLKKLGFQKIYTLNGGITTWKLNNLPLLKK